MSAPITDTQARWMRCPDCWAAPGKACSVPTSTMRREVSWYHSSRLAQRERARSPLLTHLCPRHHADGLLPQQSVNLALECPQCRVEDLPE